MLVVVGIRNAGTPASVWAYDDNAVLLWVYDTGGTTRACVVDDDNNVYVVGTRANSKNFWKLDSDGNLLGSLDIQSESFTWDVALDTDGNIFVSKVIGVGSFGATKISADLQTETEFAPGDSGIAIFVSYLDGHVYVGSGGAADNLRKFDKDDLSSELWSKDPSTSQNCKEIRELSNGDIIAAIGQSSSEGIYSYSQDGVTQNWYWSDDGDIHGLAIDSNDNIYVGVANNGSYFYCIDKDGNNLWSIDTTQDIESVVEYQGRIYVCGDRTSNYSAWEVDLVNHVLINLVDTGTNAQGISTTGSTKPIFAQPRDLTYSKKLVAAAKNELWYESTAGTMAQLAASVGELNIANPLSMFEAYGKVFIANHSNLKIADFINGKLHTTNILPAGVYPRHGTVIEATGGTASGAKMVVDYITDLTGDTYIYGHRITATTFQSGDVCTATIDEGAVSFTLDAAEVIGPHWYDWTTYGNAAKDDTTYGALPNKATIGCLYRGRPTVSGNPEYPHQWYMMRQGNPFDALYGINDAQSAVAGHDADMGEIGDIVRALIPYKDDYLVAGSVSSIWLFTGDPAEGGSLNELDLTTGIFGAQSWCFDGEENLWFWGTNGIYKTKIPGKPICMSEIRLPDLVKAEAVNPLTHRILLNYDRRRAGIVITITTLSDATN